MKYAFGLAIGVVSASVASMSEPAASEPVGRVRIDRSGMERVEAGPQAGTRGTELGKKPKSGSQVPDQKSRPDDGDNDGADSNSRPRLNPGDPPGCVFTKKPLELIV